MKQIAPSIVPAVLRSRVRRLSHGVFPEKLRFRSFIIVLLLSSASWSNEQPLTGNFCSPKTKPKEAVRDNEVCEGKLRRLFFYSRVGLSRAVGVGPSQSFCSERGGDRE